jgi:uncharacterized RDD family membrane protein YckC
VTSEARVERAVSQQGHYAGAVTRLVAFVIDQAAVTGVFAVVTAVIAWVLSLVTAGEVNWDPDTGFTALVFIVWWIVYYAYPWAVSGKTLGMALFGIRVVRRDGSRARPGNAVKRALALPLSFLTFGIGFLPIIFGKERRALHDAIAGTAVVYSWDARGARLRFLARQQRPEETVPA